MVRDGQLEFADFVASSGRTLYELEATLLYDVGSAGYAYPFYDARKINWDDLRTHGAVAFAATHHHRSPHLYATSRHATPPSTPTETTAASTAFPAAAAVMVVCGGCPPPNHHRGGGRTTVQPPQPHLVVSGCDGATPSKASG
nr:hypothetical protein [Tanacetum cinerariifolium]